MNRKNRPWIEGLADDLRSPVFVHAFRAACREEGVAEIVVRKAIRRARRVQSPIRPRARRDTIATPNS